MRIRIQLFYLNADPDPGSQTNADRCGSADPDPGLAWKSQKVEFCMKNIIDKKKHNYHEGTKAFLKCRKPGLFVKIFFGQFQSSRIGSGSAFPIRILIQDCQMNADPCGSGSTTLLIRDENKCFGIYKVKLSSSAEFAVFYIGGCVPPSCLFLSFTTCLNWFTEKLLPTTVLPPFVFFYLILFIYRPLGIRQSSGARICKHLRSPGIDSASLCSLAGRYDK